MFISALLVSWAVSVSASCLHGTTLYRRSDPVTFGYTGEQGPLNWANLSPNNTLCGTGSTQSPINIDDSIEKASSNPTISIPNVESAEFENLGTTLEVIIDGTTTFNGDTYSLKQYHFHTPSEHRIKEEYYPLEMHMVHQSEDESILVLAALFQLTEDTTTSAFLTNTTTNLEEIEEAGSSTETGPLDLSELVDALQSQSLYQYSGSLTTPPCSEGVTFLVLENPLPINVRTYNAMKNIMKFNARYTQNSLGEANLLALGDADSTNSGQNSLTVVHAFNVFTVAVVLLQTILMF